jgi:hypothetical protein
MMLHSPEVGVWYRHRQSRTSFEVVALDETHGTIEIQYPDGGLDELDWREWQIGKYVDAPPPDDALSMLGMDEEDDGEDDLQADDPLFDAFDRYDWSDNSDFGDI